MSRPPYPPQPPGGFDQPSLDHPDMLRYDTPPNQQRATNISLGAAIVAFANAVLACVVSFGLGLNAQQEASISGVVNASVLLVIAGSHLYGQVTADRQHRERWSHLNGDE